jgi:hypothetical protein
MLDELADALPFVSEQAVQLDATHNVCGNKNRFRTGKVELVMDEAWRSHLSGRSQKVVSTLTSLLRRRYGYSGK